MVDSFHFIFLVTAKVTSSKVIRTFPPFMYLSPLISELNAFFKVRDSLMRKEGGKERNGKLLEVQIFQNVIIILLSSRFLLLTFHMVVIHQAFFEVRKRECFTRE